MKQVLKWVGIAILVPILLFIILAVMLYLPPVQNWAVKQVASIASEKTGMKISVEHVNLEFPLNLGVEGVHVLKEVANDSISTSGDTKSCDYDTVADIRKMVVKVQLKPLFRKQVEVDALELNEIKFNTTDFISAARVKGSAGRIFLESHGIDLTKEHLRVDVAELADANVDVALSDSVPPDTTESENKWKILVDKLDISRSHVRVHMPGDTLQVAAYLGNVQADNGTFDLGKGDYRVSRLNWSNGALQYDNLAQKTADGLDYNHLSLNEIRLDLDSLSYKEPRLNLLVKSLSLKEKSGLEITELSGPLALDSAKFYLPDFKLRTPESTLDAHVAMDLNAFEDSMPGKIHMTANGSFGKQDIMRFLGGMPQRFTRQWPNQPLTVKTVLSGNMKQLEFTGLNAKLPTAFNINTKGKIYNLNDLDHLKTDLDLTANTYNLNFLTALVDPKTMEGIRIPQSIGLKGRLKSDGSHYQVDLAAMEGSGSVKAKANIDTKTMTYQADIKARQLQLKHFLPDYDMGAFTGSIALKGSGTDLFSKKTNMVANADISHFTFNKYNLNGIKGTATVRNGRVYADIDADNALLQGRISLDALMNTKNVNATVAADIHHADLYQLYLSDKPLTVGVCLHADLATDMADYYKIQGLASDITLKSSKDTYRPDDIVMDVMTRRDTTHAVVDCGDFHLDMDASGGYKKLMSLGETLMKEVTGQLKEKHIDQMALRRKFPNARVRLKTGSDNFFSRMITQMGYSFERADIDMVSSPVQGLNGDAQLVSLLADSILLDTVRVAFRSDSTNIHYHAQIRNNKDNPQFVFNTLFDGMLLEKGASVNVRYYDQTEKLGVRLGAEASMEENGIRLHMLSDDAVIAYRKAHINDDNYVFLADDRRISANLSILADDGTGLKVYSNDENENALQDLTLSLNKLDLAELTSVIPYLPSITGFVDGDYHFVQEEKQVSVSSSMSVADMTYEGNRMGNLGLDFVYMPTEDGTHHVDGILMVEGEEVGSISGGYQSEGDGHLDAVLNLVRLPMSLVNGFIPDQLFGLAGYGEGELTVKGKLSSPQVDGEVYLDSCRLFSIPYGIDMRFSNDPVRIVGSHLLLENFEMFAHNENPLNMAGDIDFSNLDRITMDVKMRARNFQLINSKENSKSVAYGKAFVNFFGLLKGPIDNLNMRGKLDVLGTTDVGYILRDSPLTTDNQLDELVKFTDFSDTTQIVVNRPDLSGLKMDLTMDVAEGAHVMAYLNADKSNYVDLMGGGTLRMQYNPIDNIRLTGRYTLDNGEMKYSLPIIPLKTFTIQDGSYIEFTGDPMNPTLNITATERTKATVTGTNGVGRGVDFDCGVIITRTLDDMGLEFTLDAPEDMSLHNELQSMSVEQRGKLAVTMLTTGMYLADGNTSGFSVNSALSSFLESEINNITGNALRTLDLSIGLDNSTDATGAMHTDYSFKFAKRFWNNRLKISVGGKVTTGSQVADQNTSFFDNVTMEYRLDDTANKYVKVFYNNNAYDWLEGYTQEYGVGFIWRRTLQHFKDIFKLKDQSQLPVPGNTPQSVPVSPKEGTLIIPVDSIKPKE